MLIPKKTYDEIYSRLRSSLIGYASRFTKQSSTAEDIVQEAFLKVIEASENRTIELPEHYIYRTTRNLALKEINKKSHKLTDSLGDFSSETDLVSGKSLEDEHEMRQMLGLAFEAINQLPERCRQVFIYRRVYGYTHKEIAEEMGISIKTVEAHLTRAILHCSDFLDKVDTPRSTHSKTIN